ncbi:MAG: ATP-dependent helicase, partial [Desulfobacterales bacterium]|nr:ATP-dependent helicase [Desulfobacterales bacterium]
TTPESLNLLVSSKNSRLMLTGIATVILDEIHAVVGTKRGTHLITAVDRLIPLTGEFQRIALSATVRPMKKVAEFVGGYEITGHAAEPHYKKRQVSVIRSENRKKYSVQVCFPENARELMADDSWWPALIASFKKITDQNRSTLFFANSRRLTEKVARMINEDEHEEIAYSHHGSLSREIRLAVEQKLKHGELKAIVATNSLELGIDIGDLDQVVLIQSPNSVSSGIQRIGRAGHGVGQVSRGRIFPTHGRDFLDTAVIARAIMKQDIEEVYPTDCPLDVLAQVILSMTGVEQWDIDELFGFLRTMYPFHSLSRRQFDLVLDMLAGRYADTRIRELRPRVSVDRTDNTVRAKSGVMMLIYMAGGTIPDRGHFNLRLQDSKAKIGELDEEFVWERNIGETFALGAQTWHIKKITHNDVEVVPVENKPGIFPFWRAESQNRTFHFSRKIGEFLEYANDRLEQPDFEKGLWEKYYMEPCAAEELTAFLLRQKDMTGADLPHRRHLLIEHFDDLFNKADSKQVILHTLWGGRINRPFAMALAAAWEEQYKYPLEVFPDDDCILIMLPHNFNAGDILNLVSSENVETLLRGKLEKTGFFGAKFRENAGRALLLPKASFKKRMPLWLNRLRSKKLMDAVKPLTDFPILLETWRTCLRDEFDLENLKLLLDEIADGHICISETKTTIASPFTSNLIWQQTNKYMYEDDTPGPGKTSSLNEELLREVVMSSRLRPRIPENLIQMLDRKLKRTAPGYAPGSPVDLLDWVKERLLIPGNEWQELILAVERDHGIIREELLFPLAEKLVMVNMPGASVSCACAVETLPRIAECFGISGEMITVSPVSGEHEGLAQITEKQFQNNRYEPDLLSDQVEKPSLSDFVIQWLSFYGPVEAVLLKNTMGLENEALDDLIKTLAHDQSIVADKFREHSETDEICDRENLEILLRMFRRSRQPGFKALSSDFLPLFLAAFQGITYQGITGQGESLEDLQERLDQLFGFPAPAGAWEEYIFPARLEPYYTSWLDSLMQSSELLWFGCGDRKISFAFEGDLELFQDENNNAGKDSENTEISALDQMMPDIRGKYSFFDIVRLYGKDSGEAAEKLWQLTWQGLVANDTFDVLRKGILNKFAPFKFQDKKKTGRRGQFNRWKSANPLMGNWHVLDFGQDNRDIMEKEDLVKDRIRQLFRRYGILFRELCARELPVMNWGRLFRTLRLMELSGEIFSGHFFEGIPGLQFITGEAFRFLNRPLPEDSIYWINAADPCSLCGVRLEGMKYNLPSRLPSTHLVFHGTELVIISRRNGKLLDIKTAPDSPFLQEYLAFFKVLLNRQFNPVRHVIVEKINDEPAAKSEYVKPFKEFGFAETYKGLELRRLY